MAHTTSGGVIDVLQSQHEQVKKLLSQIGSGKGASAADDFCELHHKIAVHETAEEEIVYPALRSTGPDGERVVHPGDRHALRLGGHEAEHQQCVGEHETAFLVQLPERFGPREQVHGQLVIPALVGLLGRQRVGVSPV